MMVDSEISPGSTPGDPASIDSNTAGQVSVAEVIRLQSGVPRRSAIARLFGASPLSDDAQPRYQAALGEIEVGESLDGLRTDWVVLHDVPVDAACVAVDHLVIGRGGVYIVDTRSFPGETVWASGRSFMVGGVRHPYIRAIEFEMGRVERLLTSAAQRPVEVAGILAVVAPKSLTVGEEHRDVAVLDSTALVGWLRSRPVVLTAAEVVEIGAAASRASAWEATKIRADSAVRDREDFAALRRTVRSAWRVRVIWASAIAIGGAGTFLGMTYSILLGTIGSVAP